MASILQRLDDLIRGSLHRFVDRALANNSLVFFDQDVRDMEAAIAHLEKATAGMYAAARANERRLTQHQEDVAELEKHLERLVARGVESTSERWMVAQAELDAKRGLVIETQAQIERQQAQYETLMKQLREVEVVSQTLQDSRPRLESLLILARAHRSVKKVEMTLEGLRGLGGTEVAGVAEGIYRRFYEAETRLEAIRQAEDLSMVAEIQELEVEDQLEARRRRLGLAPDVVMPAPPRDAVAPASGSPEPGPAPESPPDEAVPAPEGPADEAVPAPEGPADEAVPAPEGPADEAVQEPLIEEPPSQKPTPVEPPDAPVAGPEPEEATPPSPKSHNL